MKSLYFRIKNPAYGRHQLSRPMRIEAPLPKMYAKQCFEKNRSNFFKLCHHRPILGIRSLTRSLHDTRKWEFWISLINVKKIREKNTPIFENFVITGQNKNIFFNQRSSRPPEVGVSDFAHKCNYVSEKMAPSLFWKIVSSQAKIRNGIFDQNFFDLRKWVFCNGTHKHRDWQTDGHGDFMTELVKR